ncbi:PAS domain S-box protein [Bacillus weihaiensis]|uniref:PAS domain S-box protein n=1 Tax=Bacillus weihaiensis TaxID=1547283 RepID=UPI002352BB30|nr:PAS domain S-box protein [Bacillus weihaiensis]
MKPKTTSKKKEKLEVFIKNSGFFGFNRDHAGYYALDTTGRYVRVNETCEQATGFNKDELYELTYKDLLVKEDLEAVKERFHRVLSGEIQHFTCLVQTKNREKREIEVINTPIIVDHEIIGVYGTAKDMTEVNNSKRDLEESEALHRSIVEHSPDGVLIVQNDQIVFVNQTATSLLGAKNKEEIFARHIKEFFCHSKEDPFPLSLMEEIQGESSVLNEEELVKVTGTKVELGVQFIPTIYKGKHALYIMLRDLTEKKLAHDMMVYSEKLSVAGQLAAGIAHEIRNPITAIKGFLQLMEDDSNYRKDFFPVLTAEMNRIELILSELLALAKPQLEDYKPMNVAKILQHVIALTKSQAILHNITIKPFIHLHSVSIVCDENKIKQVFINFIKNAIEAMSDTSGTISVYAKQNEDGCVLIEIVDEGPGIPKEIVKKIGTPFFTTKENGTGLGIMVSQEIIKQHNGELNIDSNDAGTKISVRFPVHT